MNSNKPYLLRAFYQWIVDNGLTPYVVVNTEIEGVALEMLSQYIRDGQIVLNISPFATEDLNLGNRRVSFRASFAGVEYSLDIPVRAIMAIYAKENNVGQMFDVEESEDDLPLDGASKTEKKPKLHIVE